MTKKNKNKKVESSKLQVKKQLPQIIEEWPDNALEGGVFQLVKYISEKSKK